MVQKRQNGQFSFQIFATKWREQKDAEGVSHGYHIREEFANEYINIFRHFVLNCIESN